MEQILVMLEHLANGANMATMSVKGHLRLGRISPWCSTSASPSPKCHNGCSLRAGSSTMAAGSQRTMPLAFSFYYLNNSHVDNLADVVTN